MTLPVNDPPARRQAFGPPPSAGRDRLEVGAHGARVPRGPVRGTSGSPLKPVAPHRLLAALSRVPPQ